MEIKQTHKIIEDGREDVFIVINGHKLIVMPEEGYKTNKKYGMTRQDGISVA